MIRKILIANRGEIAVRIIRACAEMGIRSVAIYSEADRFSLHVKKADEAFSLGSDPLAGYLNVHRIVNLAASTGCDAIHPGYGFLSENPELAAACARRGITFIGPTAEVLNQPQHPYSKGLIASTPSVEQGNIDTELFQISGAMPRLDALPSGCAFHPRCEHASDGCTDRRPDLLQQRVACWLYADG